MSVDRYGDDHETEVRSYERLSSRCKLNSDAIRQVVAMLLPRPSTSHGFRAKPFQRNRPCSRSIVLVAMFTAIVDVIFEREKHAHEIIRTSIMT